MKKTAMKLDEFVKIVATSANELTDEMSDWCNG